MMKQQTPFADPIDDRIQQQPITAGNDRQRRRDRADDRTRVGNRREIDEEHSLVEVVETGEAVLDRSSRLSDSTGSGEGDQVRGVEMLPDCFQQPIPTDERRSDTGHIRAMSDRTARRWEVVLQIGVLDLEESDGPDIAKPMRAERAHFDTVG
jgi:hypothetical protein